MKRAVFGMGIAMINHWAIIKEKFDPQFAIDNNPEKWGKIDLFTGLECFCFDSISDYYDVEILISVGDIYAVQAIKKQLELKNIKYKILIELFDEWYEDALLPKHIRTMATNKKKIILFNTPEHDNVGDHLIAWSEMQFLINNFKDYTIFEITDDEYLKYHKKIKNKINKDDIILISGGGYAGSLWLYNGENNIREIITEYPDNRVVILPQTVFFENNNRGKIEYEKSKKIYQAHKNLHICAREIQSYKIFSKMMASEKNIYLLPDMAFFYKNEIKSEKQNKAVICFRKDKESILDSKTKREIISSLTQQGFTIEYITMHSGIFEGINGRKKQIDMKLNELANARIVFTDTLHCMISCALVGTTCFAYDNLSGKVSNVYKWIKDLDYVHMCKYEYDLNANDNNNKYVIPNISEYEYKLKSIIRGE